MKKIIIIVVTLLLMGACPKVFTDNLVFEKQQKYKMVAGTIRNTGDGWEVLTDTGHEPLHVSSVTNDSLKITIHHSFKAKKVVSFTITPDETYMKEGMKSGASVGLDKTVVFLSREGEKVYLNPNSVVNSKGNFWFQGIFIVE